MSPMQFSIYKGTGGKHGAIQLNLQNPHFYKGKQKDFTGSEVFELVDGKRKLKEGWKQREGAIFLDITSTKDKNIYDWDNKIVMALSVNDIGKALECFLTGNECNIMHDPGAKTDSAGIVQKYLTITSPKGTKNGCMITATKVAGGEKTTHTVPISASELIVLKNLFTQAVSSALAW